MPKAKAVNIKGVTFLGLTDSKHWIPMDGPEMFGGSEAGIRPKELLLLSLAGCTGSDVASIVDKMRMPYDRFEVHIEADMTDEHPKVYKNITVIYKFWGDQLAEDKITHAIELSEGKYCGVTAMLRPAVNINWKLELNPEE
ncbi:MAG: OsmC family peroxiredoxin [Calditrichaeota bacterium]|nr:MAG: OsmC family peroxiredoxin [Calditrichota bacterium]